ncbi:MAG TPA: glycosyltransferase family 4 protein [Solirubrobacteraceae bacterium]|jgi:glycosyltransferase involved in cell wall biosynthesis
MRHDVAIYAPFAAEQYDRGGKRGGGAERQTYLLGQALSAEGVRVAHIVNPVAAPLPLPNPHLTLVEREDYSGHRRFGRIHEAIRIWRGLNKADAPVYIVRTGSPALGIVAAFCRLRRRRLIFASSTDADFTLVRLRERIRAAMYRTGLRYTDAVVVQTAQQLGLVREAFPHIPRTAHIPSFAEPMSPADRPGQAFLWIGRIVDYKRPLRYVELARALPEARFRMVATPIPYSQDMYADLRRQAATVPNLEILSPRPHGELMRVVGEAVAIVNTSRQEGMPNIFLEGWARGVPALTLDFDPDDTIATRGIGVAAAGSWDRFVDGARRLWEARDGDARIARASRSYIEEVHAIPAVGRRWSALISELRETA